jgi:hypothetical protein
MFPMAATNGENQKFTVERYHAARKAEWDGFVREAKNATFLFARDYMDYHQDRFTDHSLMVYQDGTLRAVLPANLSADGVLISHEGLTFGGLVVSRSATLEELLASFHAILRDLQQRHISQLRYKRIPGFYNTLPDDEVAYALFLLEARLYRRDCSTTVVQTDRLPLRKGHHSTIVKARKQGVRVVAETSFQPFWDGVLIPRLTARYGVKPVHSLEEITLLAGRFPEQIKQYSAYCGAEILAGATIYETPTVAHVQYCAATEKGRKLGAQTYLTSDLLERYQAKRYFDFGISNEEEGRVLNHGLQDWKEGFGGRCYVHDFYEIATGNYPNLETAMQTAPQMAVPARQEAIPPVHSPEFAPATPLPSRTDEGVPVSRPAKFWNFINVLTGTGFGESVLDTATFSLRTFATTVG